MFMWSVVHTNVHCIFKTWSDHTVAKCHLGRAGGKREAVAIEILWISTPNKGWAPQTDEACRSMCPKDQTACSS